MSKPSTATTCPEGGHPLRLKKLVPIHWSDAAAATASTSTTTSSSRNYCCPVCTKQLTNATKTVAIRPCGHVVCAACVSTLLASLVCSFDRFADDKRWCGPSHESRENRRPRGKVLRVLDGVPRCRLHSAGIGRNRIRRPRRQSHRHRRDPHCSNLAASCASATFLARFHKSDSCTAVVD